MAISPFKLTETTQTNLEVSNMMTFASSRGTDVFSGVIISDENVRDGNQKMMAV